MPSRSRSRVHPDRLPSSDAELGRRSFQRCRPTADLTSQREAVRQRFAATTEAPGRVSVRGREVERSRPGSALGAERVFAGRMLRVVRKDETPHAGFDESTTCRRALRRPMSIALQHQWTVRRDATIASCTRLDQEAWARRGCANGKAVTTSALAYIILGHVEHHLEVLRDRYGV